MEQRSYRMEIRAAAQEEKRRVSGYAAVFESLSSDMGGWYEEIAKRAFNRALTQQGHDILAVWCHDMSKPLASRDAGSLSLSEDDNGLAFEMEPVMGTTWAQDAMAAIDGKLVRKMSFRFVAHGEEWNKRIDGKPVRTLTDLDIFEISPVPMPAYEDTILEARSAQEAYQRFLAKGERALSAANSKALARFRFALAKNHSRRPSNEKP